MTYISNTIKSIKKSILRFRLWIYNESDEIAEVSIFTFGNNEFDIVDYIPKTYQVISLFENKIFKLNHFQIESFVKYQFENSKFKNKFYVEITKYCNNQIIYYSNQLNDNNILYAPINNRIIYKIQKFTSFRDFLEIFYNEHKEENIRNINSTNNVQLMELESLKLQYTHIEEKLIIESKRVFELENVLKLEIEKNQILKSENHNLKTLIDFVNSQNEKLLNESSNLKSENISQEENIQILNQTVENLQIKLKEIKRRRFVVNEKYTYQDLIVMFIQFIKLSDRSKGKPPYPSEKIILDMNYDLLCHILCKYFKFKEEIEFEGVSSIVRKLKEEEDFIDSNTYELIKNKNSYNERNNDKV